MSQASATAANPHKHHGLFLTLWYAFIGLFSAKRRNRTDVVCFSMHRSFHLWLLILFGWIVSAILRHYEHQNVMPGSRVLVIWSTIYLALLLYSISMLLFDVNIGMLLIGTGLILLIWISAKYIDAMHHVRILGYVTDHFRALRPEMGGGFASVISWILFGQWFVALMETFRAGRISFDPTTIKEIHVITGDHDIDRSGLNFRANYPNLLEFILGFGSGRIVAEDSSGNEKHVWPHIFGLYFLWNRIDDIIHDRVTQVDNTKEEPVEVQEIATPKAIDPAKH